MARLFLILGSIAGLLSVACGALGTHMLEPKLAEWYQADQLPKKLENWNVAVRYMFFHGLALLVVASLSTRQIQRSLASAGLFFVIGMVLFSGALFGWVLLDIKFLVHIVPLGGLAFMVGWVCLIFFAAGFRSGVTDA